MTSFDEQRVNMVESQVRPSDVTDRRLLRAMGAVPREAFTDAKLHAIAYMDRDLPIAAEGRSGGRRALLAPRVLARMVQALEIGDGHRVLDVGTATGYGAAVLAQIAGAVVALESDAALAASATTTLKRLGRENVTVVSGPLSGGAATEGPYDAILIEGVVPDVGPALLDQLKDGGRLVAILAAAGGSRVMLWRRVGAAVDRRPIMDASGPALPGFETAPAFVF